MILEVLIGPELVRSMGSENEVREVLDLVRGKLGEDLHQLVARMTIFVDAKPVHSFIAHAGDAMAK